MKNKKEKNINREVPEKNSLRRAIYNARNIVDTLKSLSIIGGVFLLIAAIGGLLGIEITAEATTFNFIDSEQIKTTILMAIEIVYTVFLYLSLKNAVTLLDNLLDFGIFNDKTIKCFDIITKYLIMLWIVGLAATLELNVYLIVIIAIVNLCKHIFIYGKSLEEEIKEVI
jgi:hypothetical protein